MSLTSVDEALRLILASATVSRETETVPLRRGMGRTLARDLVALRRQPPGAMSAMDGYAVRSDDVATVPAVLAIVGASQAGRGFSGTLGPREAIRIFTGAPLPDGSDAVVIQEDTRATADTVTALQSVAPGRHVRRAGQDFDAGEVLLRTGQRLAPADLALAAAMNYPTLEVFRRARVAVLATGDELVLPGGRPGPDQIVASNNFALMALAEAAGADVIDLGIARDDLGDLSASIARAQAEKADLLVTLGGASVGDHDLVQRALLAEGMALGFWRIAMRPGKPLMHGRLDAMQVLGLPGNPVSAIVCGLLFVRPLIRALCGDPEAGADPSEPAELAIAVPANDARQDYVRGHDRVRRARPPACRTRSPAGLVPPQSAVGCGLPRDPPAFRAGSAVRIGLPDDPPEPTQRLIASRLAERTGNR